MHIQNLHPWDVSPSEAIRIQNFLAPRLKLTGSPDNIRTIAGADCSLDLDRNEACAGVVVFSFPSFESIEYVSARKPLVFPEVPGLLTFREGPALLEAFARLKSEPDVIFFDGEGAAHPNGIGIASHLGFFLNKPSIGCGKSLLCGTHDTVGPAAGDVEDIDYSGRRIGFALRTKPKTNPIIVSPGHMIGFEESLALVLRCLDGYRIPKPIRLADDYVAKVKKDQGGSGLGVGKR